MGSILDLEISFDKAQQNLKFVLRGNPLASRCLEQNSENFRLKKLKILKTFHCAERTNELLYLIINYFPKNTRKCPCFKEKKTKNSKGR